MKKAVLREDMMAITQDLTQSMVLSQMLYWTKTLDVVNELIFEENQRLAEEGLPQCEYNYGWIWKSAREMRGDLMCAFTEDAVQKAFQSLCKVGLLMKRRNPSLKYDRKLQYRIDLLLLRRKLKEAGWQMTDFILADASIEMKTIPPITECIPPITEWKPRIAEWNPPITETITETTYKITTENTSQTTIHPTENPQGGESDQHSLPPDQTQADATTKGRTADAVIKNPTPNCASPLPELENNKAKLNRMFKRRDTTRWSAKELQALEITLGTTDEEWDALLAYYAHAGKEGYFCRNNLITCLNNWAGEIDKARRGKQAVYPKGNESHPSAPKHTPSGHKLSGREEEFWTWLKAWRPYEKRCDIRSVREDYVYDFLNGVVHEPEEPVTEIKLPRVEEDELF